MEVVSKIVRYHKYCKNCEHYNKESWEDPCHECLSTPVREHSHKPLHYKEKTASQKKQGV